MDKAKFRPSSCVAETGSDMFMMRIQRDGKTHKNRDLEFNIMTYAHDAKKKSVHLQPFKYTTLMYLRDVMGSPSMALNSRVFFYLNNQ
jgi:hypothetical protein